MRSFKIALLVAVISLVTVTQVSARPSASMMSALKPPVLKCGKGSILVQGSKILLNKKPSCKLGNKTVGSTTTWRSLAADPSGVACQMGTSAGRGLSAPNTFGVTAGGKTAGKWPGRFTITFTTTARSGKQSVRATTTWSKVTPDPRNFCGLPPKFTYASGSPGPATWGTSPTFDSATGVLNAGSTIQVPGAKTCRWQTPSPLKQYSYLTSDYQAKCDNGYRIQVWVYIYYYIDNNTTMECDAGISGVSGFVVSPTWGPGGMNVMMRVVSWDENNTQLPRVDGSFKNFAITHLSGSVDPCSAELKQP